MTEPGSDRSTEALIVAASRLAASKSPPSGPNKRLIGAAVVAVAVIGGAIAFAATRGSDDENDSNVTVPTVSSVPTSTSISDLGSTSTSTSAAPLDTATSTTLAPTAVTAAPTTAVVVDTTVAPPPPETTIAPAATVPVDASGAPGPSAAPSGSPTNYAVYKDGVLYLVGSIGSPEMAAAVRAQAEQVLPPQNVQGEFTIDPSAGGPSGIVRSDSGVLFDSGSAVIKPSFFDDLDLVVAVMALKPGATVEIHGFTDSVGTDEHNLVLSSARVAAITDYLASRGVSAERLQGIPHGEADPVGDNSTPEGRALNRRIDVVFVNLFN